MCKIITVSNQKGGVSKTTTTYNLGASLALNHNKKILLVDTDPQANLSEYLGYKPNTKPTITQLVMSVCMQGIIKPDAVMETIRHCETANLDYIPSDINLASSEMMMSTMISRETILKRILLKEITCNYDFVLIDCLPSLGILLINALTIADKVLIPVQTQKFSMDGLQALENLYQQIKETINPDISLLGVLPIMADRTTVSKNAVNTLKEKYRQIIFDTVISKSVDAAKSSEIHMPLCIMGCKLGTEYEHLACEVLKRCKDE